MDLRPARPAGTIEFGAAPPGALMWAPSHDGDAPEDRIVRGAFGHILASGHCTNEQARELGRTMGREARPPDLQGFLEAFSHLGLGALRLSVHGPARWVVEGHALHGADAARSLTCALALGFVEGAIGAIDGREALGAETQCRSRGAAVCEFHIRQK